MSITSAANKELVEGYKKNFFKEVEKSLSEDFPKKIFELDALHKVLLNL